MILAGCPVYNRGWVLPKWFQAVESHIAPDNYIFAWTPSDDDTFNVILNWQRKVNKKFIIIKVEEGTHGTDRDWADQERIRTLALMRNLILDEVANQGAEFLSVDSDIVLRGRGFLHHREEWDVFGPTVALATDRTIINAFTHRRPDGWVVRAKPGHHGAVDILCAAKYMNKDVVQQVRYGFHPRGEDFAFGQAAKERGFSMGLCPEITEHHMSRGRPPIIPAAINMESTRVHRFGGY